jgi:hypothetical protein
MKRISQQTVSAAKHRSHTERSDALVFYDSWGRSYRGRTKEPNSNASDAYLVERIHHSFRNFVLFNVSKAFF